MTGLRQQLVAARRRFRPGTAVKLGLSRRFLMAVDRRWAFATASYDGLPVVVRVGVRDRGPSVLVCSISRSYPVCGWFSPECLIVRRNSR
jgi:hypothetical protein